METKKYYVYIHTFPNGKRYIGLTVQDVKRRWGNGKNYKGQVVYNPILKYGWKNIKHTVYEVDTKEEMEYLEKYLIAYYHTTDRKYGYNVSTGGEERNGVPSKYRKPVNQYDKKGNFIKTWESISAIERELNYDRCTVRKCLKKKVPTAYGFYWFFTNETPVFKTYKTRRKVYQYSLTGELIKVFKSAAEAARSLGKSDNTSIIRCCNKKAKTAFKFIWKYEC